MRAPKNSHATEGIVTSDAVRARKKVAGPFLRKHNRTLGLALVALVIVMAVASFKIFHKSSTVNPDIGIGDTYSITDKQYTQNQVRQFKAAPPAATASTSEWVSYYSDLMTAEYGAQDYKSVVADYQQLLTKARDSDLSINIYTNAARSYAKLGKTDAALAVLNRAEAAVKTQTTDPDRLDAYNQAITLARQEIQNGS